MLASKIKMHAEGMPATGAGIHGEKNQINNPQLQGTAVMTSAMPTAIYYRHKLLSLSVLEL